MAGLRIICLGMNQESAVAINALILHGAMVVAIIGLPPQQAQGVSDFVDMSALAAKHDIPYIATTDVNSVATRTSLATFGADTLFVLGWSQLIRQELIELLPQGVIGSHPTALPFGRGRAPVPWTILQNLDASAVTLFRIGLGVDDGHILVQKHFDLPDRPRARAVYDLVSENLVEGFCELYTRMCAGPVEGIAQDEQKATWRAKRIPADGKIDFHAPATKIDRLVRAVSEPYPGAYSYYAGQKTVFWRSEPAAGRDLKRQGAPGQILARRETDLLVQTGDIPLWLSEPDIAKIPFEKMFAVGQRFGQVAEDEILDLKRRIENLERLLLEGNDREV